jgi:hypothetical protein
MTKDALDGIAIIGMAGRFPGPQSSGSGKTSAREPNQYLFF